MPRDKLYLKVSNAAVGTRIPIKCCDSSSSDPVVYKTCQANGSWTDDQSLICNGKINFGISKQWCWVNNTLRLVDKCQF